MAVWVQAAHFIGEGEDKGPWDQFPILAVTSPEKRCGKTTLLDLLSFVTPRSEQGKGINPSPAVLYRVIEKCRPTIIMDESQSMKRRGSEASMLVSETLNASTRRDECVPRCVGDNYEPTMFSIYSPKVFAMIGDPNEVLADRCMPIRLERKVNETRVRFQLKKAKERGNALRDQLDQWKTENAEKVEKAYETLKPIRIANDRLADMMMPLQAVATIAGGLSVLEEYAKTLDDNDVQEHMQSDGIRLLTAIREIMAGREFIPTRELIDKLCDREEEPWREFNYGRPISPERLANLLRSYRIRSQKTNDRKQQKAYHAIHFREAWAKFLPPLENPPNRPTPPTISDAGGWKPKGYEVYIRGPEWAAISKKVLAHWEKVYWGGCAFCYSRGPLQVHHRTYDRFGGHERLTDCIPLCGECHAFADAARKAAKG
jgi:putative DNA primase/helicase